MQESPIGWVGGKKHLRNDILKRFPTHATYVAVFARAAWLLFAKERATSRAEPSRDDQRSER